MWDFLSESSEAYGPASEIGFFKGLVRDANTSVRRAVGDMVDEIDTTRRKLISVVPTVTLPEAPWAKLGAGSGGVPSSEALPRRGSFSGGNSAACQVQPQVCGGNTGKTARLAKAWLLGKACFKNNCFVWSAGVVVAAGMEMNLVRWAGVRVGLGLVHWWVRGGVNARVVWERAGCICAFVFSLMGAPLRVSACFRSPWMTSFSGQQLRSAACLCPFLLAFLKIR